VRSLARMTGPVSQGRGRPPLSPGWGSPASVQRYRRDVSTRGLILAALLCGLAILAAFALQVSLLK
jgi:hypothetical protein